MRQDTPAKMDSSGGRHRAALASAAKGIHRRSCIPVQQKRKLWGTRKTPTAEDVIHVINFNSSVKTGLTVKRKYKSSARYPHMMSKWWFVISEEENPLQQLQREWSTANNQIEGIWSLEPLLCYDPESTRTVGSNHSDTTPPTSVHQPPNAHQDSESAMTPLGSNSWQH